MMELVAALIAAYKANVTLMALTAGGIRQGTARTGAWDYVTLTATPGTSMPTYDGHPLANGVIQFSVWCENGGDRAQAIANAIVDYFKSYVPALSRGQVTNVNLQGPYFAMVQNTKNENGKTVVMVPIRFNYSGVLY